jgi:hypothetical protein
VKTRSTTVVQTIKKKFLADIISKRTNFEYFTLTGNELKICVQIAKWLEFKIEAKHYPEEDNYSYHLLIK